MSALLYRPDMDAVRERLTRWWNGGDFGRPALQATALRETPWETAPALPRPEGWVTDYSTRDYDYRVNLSARACVGLDFFAEAVPNVAPDLAPNCLALYLGCNGVEMPGTVWAEPCMASPDTARFEYDPNNFYWQFSKRLGADQVRLGRGKFLVQFPDLIEGLDTLAAMRDTEKLLFDLIERPDWVHRCLRRITDLYFRYYDVFYDMFRDEVGGSHFWCWAPGRMAKFQCDFSAMISAEMFGEFMLPVLTEMCERVSYCMYHWDGPGALQHHDHLLSIPKLGMLQWTPGSGAEPAAHRRWWPYFHKTVEAGKKIYIGVSNAEEFKALQKEFGAKLNQFLISVWTNDRRQVMDILRLAGAV